MGATVSSDDCGDMVPEATVIDYRSSGSFDSLQSHAALLARMKAAVNRALRVLKEPPLPDGAFVKVVALLKESTARCRQQNSNFISEDLAKDGFSPPKLEDLQVPATLVHHAQLVYEIEELDTVRSALRQGNLELLSHSTVGGKFRTPYYLCYNAKSKQALLVIRGTLTLSATLTGLMSDVTPLDDGETFAHKGFAQAAMAVQREVLPTLRQFLLPQGFQLDLVGHSAGGAVACCLAKLLKNQKIDCRCFTFGCPPCLDKESALAMRSYTTSVVHHDDLITRSSLSSYKLLADVVRHIATNSSSSKVHADEMPDLLATVAGQNPRVAAHRDLHVPGRAIFLYEEDCAVSACCGDGTLGTLRRLEVTDTCLGDHLCSAYMAALQEATTKLCGDTMSDYRPWLVHAVFESGSSEDSDGVASEASTVEEDEDNDHGVKH